MFIFSSAIVALGLVAGSIVSWMAEEELKGGKKYFMLVEKLILVFIAIALAYFYSTLSLVLIPLLLIGIFLRNTLFNYLIFSLAFYVSFDILPKFLIISSLIFLYGFPMAALFLGHRTKIEYYKKDSGFSPKRFLKYLWLISIPGLIFFLLTNLLIIVF